MADIKKTAGTSNCDEEHGGKRGPRGHRGHRGPSGPATSLVGPTGGAPGALGAGEDILAGSVIAAGGSAVLALADGSPRSNVLGIASKNIPAGQIVEYGSVGPLDLDGFVFEPSALSVVINCHIVVTPFGPRKVCRVVANHAFYLSQTVPGAMTPTKPSSGQIIKIGVSLSETVINLQIETLTSPTTSFPVLSPVFVGTDFIAVAGFVNQVDCAGAGRTASLPVASSVSNGTCVGIKKSNRADASAVSLFTVLASDTIDGAPGQGGGFLNAFLDNTGSSVLLVSDGVSNWTILAGGNDNGF